MSGKQNPIFAIGYSNYAISKFVKLLEAHRVTMLVDVRTIPKSRHQPDFNKSALSLRLKRRGIRYMHFPELGGLRKPLKDSINKGWRNDSFRGFADYMQKREFATAIVKLIEVSKRYNVAVMCSEGNPFRCHRSLIADALTVRHKQVYHISGLSSRKEHKLTPFAKIKGTRITYPE